MKKIMALLVAGLFLFQLKAQDIAYAHEVVKVLASPDFKGRGYTGDGALKAAKYIKSQFIEAGLKSFGKNYFQPFDVKVNLFPSMLKLVIDNIELAAGRDYLVDPASCAVNGEYSVFTIKKQDLLTDAAFNETVRLCRGRILVIDERDFKAKNSDDKKRADELVNLFKYSPTIRNAGTLIYTSDKLSWGIASFQSPKPCVIVDSTVKISYNSKVRLTIDAKITGAGTNNVIGYVEGKEKPDSFVVIMAHYDHLGEMGKDLYFPGANDNASGIAMLLNLVKYYTAFTPKYSMIFMALSGEELGLLGAQYFIENPLFDVKKIGFLVNFDLAGTGDEGIKVVNGSVYQKKFDLLKKINDEKQYLKSVQIRGAACNSDHCPFHNIGIPCFYIYTLGGDKAYHDIFDTPERLSLIEFDDYFKLVTDFLNEI